jgi:hypothetical protein
MSFAPDVPSTRQNIIEMKMLCYIPLNQRSFPSKFSIDEIINAILYKLDNLAYITIFSIISPFH